MNVKKLLVITINYNTPEITEAAIRAFRENEPELDAEIILIDNASEKKLNPEVINELGVKYIENVLNLGFAKAVNQGIKLLDSEYVLLLNSDVLIKKGAVGKMLEYIENNKEAGVAGAKFYYPDGCWQISAGRFPSLGREFLRLTTLYKIMPFSTFYSQEKKEASEADWVSGGCMLIKKEVIDKIGLFNENYFFGVEDMDFCLRVKKGGWKIVYCPSAKVAHYHAASSGGLKSLWRIKKEKEAMDYFFKENYPKKIITRLLVRLMFDLKVYLLFFLDSCLRRNDSKKYIPQDATIAITYRCNSHCRMCNIWRAKNPQDLPLAFFYNLSPHLKYINLSGGEPFLRDDLAEIVAIVKKVSPRAQIIISSNGLATNMILEKMKRILAIDKKIGVRISLDGIGETHNQIRGIPNIYEQALETIKKLKETGVKNLGISFTIMDFNAKELLPIYKLTKELNLQLALALVQNSDIYFQKSDNKINALKEVAEGLNYVIKKELASWRLKKWLRAYYDYGLLYYAQSKKRLLPSGAGFDSLFIDPEGNIFPSNLINFKMGNLGKGKLDDLWQSTEAMVARNKIKEEEIEESWIICTIRGEMKKHIGKVLMWIMINKFFFPSLRRRG